MEQKTEFKPLTETILLPSKGLLYPKDNPLSTGKIEMKYMSSREEDILTNENYIEQEVVIDKLLQSLIVTPINYDDLLVGDKNAVLVAARILGQGHKYVFEYGKGKKGEVDLSKLEHKIIDYSLFTQGVNEFSYTLPNSGIPLTFKLLTHRDEKMIDEEVKGLKRLNPNLSPSISTRLKHTITSVDGVRDLKTIREFIDKGRLITLDSTPLRKYIKSITPDIDFTFYPEGSYAAEGIEIPITVDFFWPK